MIRSFYSLAYYLLVFNAALLTFAIGLICSDGLRGNKDQEELLDQVQLTLSMAITALPKIDFGNGTIEKCRRYLEKLLELRLFRSTKEAPLEQLFAAGVSARSTAGRIEPRATNETNSDQPPFIPESQDWVLDDLDMGPFVMDNNMDFMNEILGYQLPNSFSN